MGASEKTVKLKSSSHTIAHITTGKPYFSPLKKDKQTKSFCLILLIYVDSSVKYCKNAWQELLY